MVSPDDTVADVDTAPVTGESMDMYVDAPVEDFGRKSTVPKMARGLTRLVGNSSEKHTIILECIEFHLTVSNRD